MLHEEGWSDVEVEKENVFHSITLDIKYNFPNY